MAITAPLAIAGVAVAASAAQSGWNAAHQPDMPEVKLPKVKPDVVNENEGQKVAERRRRAYAGLGRSSTILTNPNALGVLGEESGSPKRLLGL